jgi:hypothetical protein
MNNLFMEHLRKYTKCVFIKVLHNITYMYTLLYARVRVCMYVRVLTSSQHQKQSY